MYIRIILLLICLPFVAEANDDKTIKELFVKYEKIMFEKKLDLIDEVFSQKFLKESGGKSEFIGKVKGLAQPKKKKPLAPTWKKGKRSDIYLAKLRAGAGSEFIIVREAGTLKIDGTMSDAD